MFKIEFDQKSVESLLKLSDRINPRDQAKAVYRGFKDAALVMESALKGNISGAILKVRSDHLRASIGSKIEAGDNGLRASIGSGARQGAPVTYAGIHETGGTIRPRVGQFLTIPLRAAQTSSGVNRFTAQQLKEGVAGYSGSFIMKGIIFGVTKSGTSTLKNGRYRKGGIVPLFVLKRSVNIPARRYLSITAEEARQDSQKAMLYGIKDALKQKESK